MSDVRAEQRIYDVAVIGAGPAGMTAAMYCARSGLDCLLLESISAGGQLAQTEHLENYPGFNQSSSGYDLSQIMLEQAECFGVNTLYDEVTSVDLAADPKRITTASGELACKSIIIATGARPAKLGLAREDELTGFGVSYCATCDGNFFKGKDVCIVGGGDTAVADAIYLSRICSHVSMIVRRDVLRATAIYHERLSRINNVDIIWNTVVDEIVEQDGHVVGVSLRNRLTDERKSLSCAAIFVAIGTVPNVEFLNDQVMLDQKGYIIADEMGKTSALGVYAAGDVRTKVLRQVSTAVADGANCAESVSEYLVERR